MRDRQNAQKSRLLEGQDPAWRRAAGVGRGFYLAAGFFLCALLASALLPLASREDTDGPDPATVVATAPAPSDSAPSPEAEPAAADRLIEGEIRRGQTFAAALSAQGLRGRLVHEIARALRPFVNFRRIPPRATFQATLDERGELRRFVYQASPIEVYEVTPSNDVLQAERREVPIARQTERIAGTVDSSLFESMDALGEKPDLTFRFVDIFLWDFDFNTHARPGDQFRLLVEKQSSGDTFVGYGKILIAEYENRGKIYTGIYFETAPGKGDFYTPDGRSVRKTFLRSPLRFTRISSGYTHHRRHPILGGVRPHLAIDYAAPHGTPIWAVADGEILSAGWDRGNGKSVVIRHRAGYKTMYNHLSRIPPGIRKGTRVEQRQVIGYVGSTGLSTGPHLDYRVIKDGRFVNPLTQKFIPGDPIPASRQAAFRDLRDRLIDQVRSSSAPQQSALSD